MHSEGEGTHEGCTYGWLGARGRAPTRGAHTVGLRGRAGEGTHEGCPYGWIICAHGGGHPRGVPLRLDYLRARGRAPTRGAPTVGCARGGGHPRGVPLRLDYLRARGRAPTRGAHTVGLFARAGEGTHEGCPTVGLRARAGEGTHEGCTYGWIICARGGHPRGHIHLGARGRAPTRGAPTVGLFARAGRAPTRGGPVVGLLGRARAGEGTHEGCPYGWATRRRR